MTNAQEKRLARIASTKGYRLEKVGKGPHHGRFAMVKTSDGSRAASANATEGFTFSLEQAEEWLSKHPEN